MYFFWSVNSSIVFGILFILSVISANLADILWVSSFAFD